MNQIQIQRQRQKLSFSEICPLWAKKYYIGNLRRQVVNGIPLDLEYGGTCVVGEAYKFTHWWWKDSINDGKLCDICDTISDDIFDIAKHSMYMVTNELSSQINDFVDHWNVSHIHE